MPARYEKAYQKRLSPGAGDAPHPGPSGLPICNTEKEDDGHIYDEKEPETQRQKAASVAKAKASQERRDPRKSSRTDKTTGNRKVMSGGRRSPFREITSPTNAGTIWCRM